MAPYEPIYDPQKGSMTTSYRSTDDSIKHIDKIQKPYANLLLRLKDALSAIDDKTRSFQIDYPRIPIEPTDAKMESEFELELKKGVDFAEYINSKLPF